MIFGSGPIKLPEDKPIWKSETRVVMFDLKSMCPGCKETYTKGVPSFFGSEPQCAFPNGSSFVSNNWQCGGLIELRTILREQVAEAMQRPSRVAYLRSDDDNHMWWEVDVESEFHIGYVYYYKDRGTTEDIRLLNSRLGNKLPSYTEVQKMVEDLKKAVK